METLIELTLKGYKVDFRSTPTGMTIMRLWAGTIIEELDTVSNSEQIKETLNNWNKIYERFKTNTPSRRGV